MKHPAQNEKSISAAQVHPVLIETGVVIAVVVSCALTAIVPNVKKATMMNFVVSVSILVELLDKWAQKLDFKSSRWASKQSRGSPSLAQSGYRSVATSFSDVLYASTSLLCNSSCIETIMCTINPINPCSIADIYKMS